METENVAITITSMIVTGFVVCVLILSIFTNFFDKSNKNE